MSVCTLAVRVRFGRVVLVAIVTINQGGDLFRVHSLSLSVNLLGQHTDAIEPHNASGIVGDPAGKAHPELG